MFRSEHNLRTRALLAMAWLAHTLYLDRLRFYGAIYRLLYPYYKRWVDGGLIRFIERHPEFLRGGHAVDLGAGFGVIARALENAVDDQHQVIAVEPAPYVFQSLNPGQNSPRRLRAIQAAVGSWNGPGTLNLHSYHQGDHRLRLNGRQGLQPHHVSVQVWRLDTLLKNLKIPYAEVRFVKMDLQGAEYQALEGMRELLAAEGELSLCLEVSEQMLQAAGASVERLFVLLETFGFKHVYRINPQGELEPVHSLKGLLAHGSSDVLFRRRAG